MGNLFVSYENILSLFILFFILFFFFIVLLKRRKYIKICNVFYVQWRRVKAHIFLIYCVFYFFNFFFFIFIFSFIILYIYCSYVNIVFKRLYSCLYLYIIYMYMGTLGFFPSVTTIYICHIYKTIFIAQSIYF